MIGRSNICDIHPIGIGGSITKKFPTTLICGKWVICCLGVMTQWAHVLHGVRRQASTTISREQSSGSLRLRPSPEDSRSIGCIQCLWLASRWPANYTTVTKLLLRWTHTNLPTVLPTLIARIHSHYSKVQVSARFSRLNRRFQWRLHAFPLTIRHLHSNLCSSCQLICLAHSVSQTMSFVKDVSTVCVNTRLCRVNGDRP